MRTTASAAACARFTRALNLYSGRAQCVNAECVCVDLNIVWRRRVSGVGRTFLLGSRRNFFSRQHRNAICIFVCMFYEVVAFDRIRIANYTNDTFAYTRTLRTSIMTMAGAGRKNQFYMHNV